METVASTLQVPRGIYDVQAIHERDGRVVDIRWANRLVVMPYPDERGHHLEVINFQNGFGALQVRGEEGAHRPVAIYEPGKRTKPVTLRSSGPGYVLFVVPAGTYDLQIRSGEKVSWMPGIEVPLDRTRLTVIPKSAPKVEPNGTSMTSLSDWELTQRLMLAALLGGVLGIEREWRNKDAGLRTNILIAIGSALFTVMSIELTDGKTGDTSRVAAQIVTGIGFLGAGAIVRTKGGVQGLTTAATIWVNAAMGVAAGGGEYHLAFIATAVTLSCCSCCSRSRSISISRTDRTLESGPPRAPAASATDA